MNHLGTFELCTAHTIRKCNKIAGQNTLQMLLLNDVDLIGEHYSKQV